MGFPEENFLRGLNLTEGQRALEATYQQLVGVHRGEIWPETAILGLWVPVAEGRIPEWVDARGVEVASLSLIPAREWPATRQSRAYRHNLALRPLQWTENGLLASLGSLPHDPRTRVVQYDVALGARQEGVFWVVESVSAAAVLPTVSVLAAFPGALEVEECELYVTTYAVSPQGRRPVLRVPVEYGSQVAYLVDEAVAGQAFAEIRGPAEYGVPELHGGRVAPAIPAPPVLNASRPQSRAFLSGLAMWELLARVVRGEIDPDQVPPRPVVYAAWTRDSRPSSQAWRDAAEACALGLSWIPSPRTGTVIAKDAATHRVTIRDDDGGSITLTLSPAVPLESIPERVEAGRPLAVCVPEGPYDAASLRSLVGSDRELWTILGSPGMGGLPQVDGIRVAPSKWLESTPGEGRWLQFPAHAAEHLVAEDAQGYGLLLWAVQQDRWDEFDFSLAPGLDFELRPWRWTRPLGSVQERRVEDRVSDRIRG